MLSCADQSLNKLPPVWPSKVAEESEESRTETVSKAGEQDTCYTDSQQLSTTVCLESQCTRQATPEPPKPW